jgi:hypothetical protein
LMACVLGTIVVRQLWSAVGEGRVTWSLAKQSTRMMALGLVLVLYATLGVLLPVLYLDGYIVAVEDSQDAQALCEITATAVSDSCPPAQRMPFWVRNGPGAVSI